MATSMSGQWKRRGRPHNTTTVLGKLIKARGLRVYEVSTAIRMEPQTLSEILNSRKELTPEIAHRLGRVLNVDPDVLLSEMKQPRKVAGDR